MLHKKIRDKYRMGGMVPPEKAKLILKEGTARGHALTEKQKRFFGWQAGGGQKPKKHEAGGMVVKSTPLTRKLKDKYLPKK